MVYKGECVVHLSSGCITVMVVTLTTVPTTHTRDNHTCNGCVMVALWCNIVIVIVSLVFGVLYTITMVTITATMRGLLPWQHMNYAYSRHFHVRYC